MLHQTLTDRITKQLTHRLHNTLTCSIDPKLALAPKPLSIDASRPLPLVPPGAPYQACSCEAPSLLMSSGDSPLPCIPASANCCQAVDRRNSASERRCTARSIISWNSARLARTCHHFTSQPSQVAFMYSDCMLMLLSIRQGQAYTSETQVIESSDTRGSVSPMLACYLCL